MESLSCSASDNRCLISMRPYLVDKCADQFGFKDVPKRNPIEKS